MGIPGSPYSRDFGNPVVILGTPLLLAYEWRESTAVSDDVADTGGTHWKRLYELSRDGKVVKKKANVARLKIYTKRAGEDETSGPSAKKSKVHRIAKYNVLYVSCIIFLHTQGTDEGTNSDGSRESKPRRLNPDPKRGGAPEPKTLPPPKRNASFV